MKLIGKIIALLLLVFVCGAFATSAYATPKARGTDVTKVAVAGSNSSTLPYVASRCGNNGNKVLLVFDDYPISLTAWKSLVSTAKSNKVGIGVAPNGKYVQSGRADIEYARSRGMLIVDHTQTHRDLAAISYRSIVWEITRPYIKSNYVRPPYGSYDYSVTKAFKEYGKKNCLWNLDPRDWDGKSPRAAADYIIKNAKPGSTVVVHLNHMGTQPSLIPYIKSGLGKRGVAMCPPWSSRTPEKMGNTYCT